jgi:hypothetical protein
MIVMETTYLQTIEIYYCGGYVPLFVRWIFFQKLTDVSERLAQIIQSIS